MGPKVKRVVKKIVKVQRTAPKRSASGNEPDVKRTRTETSPAPAAPSAPAAAAPTPAAAAPAAPAPAPAIKQPAPPPAAPPAEDADCAECDGDGVQDGDVCPWCAGTGRDPAADAAETAAPAQPPARTAPAPAPEELEDDDDYEVGSDSSGEGTQQLRQRRRTVNKDLVERFISQKSDFYIEPEIGEAREVPVMTDSIKARLAERRSKKDGEVQEGLSPVAALPPTPLFSAPNSFDSTNSGEEEFGDVVTFDFNDDAKAGKPTQEMPMWCRQEYVHRSRYVRLHQEVCDLYQYMSPTKKEDVMRKKVVCDVSDMVQKLFPGSQLLTFGSIITGLIMPTSDVDCTVLWSELDVDDEQERLHIMHRMMDKVAQHVAALEICDGPFPTVIKKTKVPLVKFTHKDTWIDVDISFGSPNGRLNSDLVLRYCRTYPVAAPLISVVKYFLQQRSMHEPFTGGLGSYAVTLMVIAFLQQHPCFAPGAPLGYGVGGLLIDFFRTYGWLMDFQTVGISVREGRYIRKKPHHYTRDRGGLYCEDPQNTDNNVTASTRQMHSIRTAFSHAFAALVSTEFPHVPQREQHAEHSSIAYRPTLLSRIVHIDHAMLDRRERVRAAYDAWFNKNPQITPESYLRRFEDEQINGARVRKLVSKLANDNDAFSEGSDEVAL